MGLVRLRSVSSPSSIQNPTPADAVAQSEDPGPPDGFDVTVSKKVVLNDDSAARALEELAATAGPTFSVRALARAIAKGTKDPAGPPDPGSARDFQRAALNDADEIFKRQSRSAKWNPNGPKTSHNCATTSLAMAVEAYGLEPAGLDAPGHVNDQKSIALAAAAMGKHDKPSDPGDFGATSYRQVTRGATQLGLKAEVHASPSVTEIDEALAKGHMMVLFGRAGTDYRKAIGHHYAGVHSVLVMGKTSDGQYLVADPLSRKGPVAISAAQLADFDTRGEKSNEVWRGS